MDKRGYTNEEAMAYVGVKRRTWTERWRPRLVAMEQGGCLIFDRGDLDALFDKFKREAAGDPVEDQVDVDQAQNGARNGRPDLKKGDTVWARKHPASTEPVRAGKLTSGIAAPAFASVVSSITKRQKAG